MLFIFFVIAVLVAYFFKLSIIESAYLIVFLMLAFAGIVAVGDILFGSLIDLLLAIPFIGLLLAKLILFIRPLIIIIIIITIGAFLKNKNN